MSEHEWKVQPVGETTRCNMLYVNSGERSFHCDCGANVFTKDGPNHYVCNGCKAGYTSAAQEAPTLLAGAAADGRGGG